MTKNIVKHKRSLCGRIGRMSLQVLAACSILVGTVGMQSCSKDELDGGVLEGQPDWLGNSIYERLQEGIEVNGSRQSFNYTLRLINDLGLTDVLMQTGSRTIFVTPDADYEAWFQTKPWGITSYDQLTLQQKKQLLNGSMIKNAYLLELMSNVPAASENVEPEDGMCMRRESAADIWDNVPFIEAKDYPQNPEQPEEPVNYAWQSVRAQAQTQGKQGIHILKDATSAPMIHFLPKFMEKNNFKSEDLELISNGSSNSITDAWINGRKVVSAEQTCKNGYIYVISGVMENNTNMAQIIHENGLTNYWAEIIDRWSVPVAMKRGDLPNGSINPQEEFWRLYPQFQGDSIYQLRYLNESGNHELKSPVAHQTEMEFNSFLKFDPGWNEYKVDNSQVIMQNDAAAMLVPTDEKLKEWFMTAGKVIYDRFNPVGNTDFSRTLRSIPYGVLKSLVNVNMLESFVATIPSKFEAITDETQRSMHVSKTDIVKCIMGCNGVVYITNKVFAPAEYSSVLFPTSQEQSGKFSVMYNALTGHYTSTQETSLDYSPYLNAMDSRFALIVPFNKYENSYSTTLRTYGPTFRMLDPCGYGLAQRYLFEFYIYNSKITARAYPCTVADDGTVTITGTGTTVTDAVVQNRLYDYINNSIIIEDITPGKQFYTTKAGSVMYAVKNANSTTFKGGLQLSTGEEIEVKQQDTYNMGDNGNGITYGVSSEETLQDGATKLEKDVKLRVDLPATAVQSVYNVLSKMKEENNGYSLFYSLIFDDTSYQLDENNKKKYTPLHATSDAANVCLNPTGNKNITLFDNYNYTFYVPSDNAIQEMIDNAYLPTWEDYDRATTDAEREKIADRIHSFVRYHVQDNAVYLNGKNYSNEFFETAKLNNATNRFYTLKVSQNGGNMTVVDAANVSHNIVGGAGNSNIICREYWIKLPNSTASKLVNPSNTTSRNATIESSSNVVVHKINGVLLFDKDIQETNWHY